MECLGLVGWYGILLVDNEQFKKNKGATYLKTTKPKTESTSCKAEGLAGAGRQEMRLAAGLYFSSSNGNCSK
jgi:hypothetical protein